MATADAHAAAANNYGLSVTPVNATPDCPLGTNKEVNMTRAIWLANIEAKRHEVNQAYAAHGFHSKEYQQGFDELHDMNMLFMAFRYRAERGLPPNAKTPYC